MAQVPSDQMLYFVKADFGRHGAAFVETDPASNCLAQVIADIVSGEIHDPIQVLECNPVEGRCRDVTEDVAQEVHNAIIYAGGPCPPRLRDWFDCVLGVSTADQLDIATGHFSVDRTAQRLRLVVENGR